MWDRFTRWRSSSEYEQKFVLEVNLEENYQRIIPIWVKKPTLYTKISDICRRIALKLKQFLAATVFLLYGYCQQFYYEISYLGCYQYFCLQRQRFRRWRSSTKHEELIPLLRMDGTCRWICPGCLREPTRFEKILGIFRRASVKIKSMITKFLVNFLLLFRAYNGSPIGTTYTVSVFPTDSRDERMYPNKSSTINMIIWVSETFPVMQVRQSWIWDEKLPKQY